MVYLEQDQSSWKSKRNTTTKTRGMDLQNQRGIQPQKSKSKRNTTTKTRRYESTIKEEYNHKIKNLPLIKKMLFIN